MADIDSYTVPKATTRSADNSHIILIGFMGSGKSTIARCLARKLGMSSIDMDNYIRRSSGMSIAQIFEVEGEAGFRARETEFLQTMDQRQRTILSCGGGVISSEVNRRLLKQLGWVIYLQVEVAVAQSRIPDTRSRPLFGDQEAARQLLNQRESLYLEVADDVVNTSPLSIPEVTNQVIQSLRQNNQIQGI
jgi:shikimate kinase